MFENFTFGAVPQPCYDPEDTCHSPRDTSGVDDSTPPPDEDALPPPPPPPRTGYDDLISALSSQTIRQHQSRSLFVHQCVASQTNEGNLAIDDNNDDDDDDGPFALPALEVASPPATPLSPSASGSVSAASIRLQRQLNVQMQSQETHVKDIGALIQDMIADRSQCTLRQNKARAYLASRLETATPPPSDKADDDAAAKSDQLITMDVDDNDDFDEGFCDDESRREEEEEEEKVEREMSLSKASLPSGIRKYGTRPPPVRRAESGAMSTKTNSRARMRRRKELA